MTKLSAGVVIGFGLLRFVLGACGGSAQDVNCGQVAFMARLARARSLQEISQAKDRAGGGFRSRLVSALRVFDLQPTAQNAARLLEAIPTSGTQATEVMTLGDSLCDGESVGDMLALSRVAERLPSQLAKAVLIAPALMPSYVGYAASAIRDPHSDYAVQMKRVCQKEHRAFERAVASLPAVDQRYLADHVIRAATCEVLAAPEAAR